MHMDKKSYRRYVEARAPRSPIVTNCLWAFLVGGGICLFAEGLGQIFRGLLDMNEENAGTVLGITGSHVKAHASGSTGYHTVFIFDTIGIETHNNSHLLLKFDPFR